MGARQVFVFASVIAFAPVWAAENGDTLRGSIDGNWRIGLSTALIRVMSSGTNAQDTTIWTGMGGWRLGILAAATDILPSSDLWRGDWFTASEFRKGMLPHVRRRHGELLDGWKRPLMLGVMARNGRADEWGVHFTAYTASFRGENGGFPVDITVRNWAMRVEYTRSSSPNPREQRPRIGFRYGCAIQAGYGTASRSGFWTGPSNRGSSAHWIGSTVIRLQPTVQFGYRSQWLNTGLQVHINALAFASGTFTGYRNSRYGPQLEEIRDQASIRTVDFANEIVQDELFFNALQLYLSVPLLQLH
ncbi:MAG: hypothetical protein IPN62_11415 [Flavobacteriales bacterium]|jgi:hypothetical protein|nr:hypothetical protein [Flavobacteriales bacterium]